MKEYVKPTVEVVDISIKDNIAAGYTNQGSSLYTVNGNSITYYVLGNASR